jgi:hypothetical protein
MNPPEILHKKITPKEVLEKLKKIGCNAEAVSHWTELNL